MSAAKLPPMGPPRKVPRNIMERMIARVLRGELSASEAARQLGVRPCTIHYHRTGGKITRVLRQHAHCHSLPIAQPRPGGLEL